MLTSPFGWGGRIEEMNGDSFVDPLHLKSFDNPCSWCGAEWDCFENQDVMAHREDCAYIQFCESEDMVDA